ncbi:MAG: KamA family radical SAM protein [bacterium]
MSAESVSYPADDGLVPRRGQSPSREWDRWQWQYAHRLTAPAQLEQVPWLTAREIGSISRVSRRYPVAIAPYFLSLIRPDDPEDPIRRQVIPDLEELTARPDEAQDPLQETEHTPVPGLVHRYPDRALLLLTNRCAVHCRHCTRKRQWQQAGWHMGPRELEQALVYLRGRPEIRDVLVSGGDPLILSDSRLDEVLGRIRRVPHVEIVRIGSRAPVVLPQRITPALCRVLKRHGPIWLNTQFNHPGEITAESAAACERLLRAGVPVNNQTVLLKGINDDAETMKSLCRGLLRIRVRPYYLHQCDPVEGAGHFRTPLQTGIRILEEMQGRVSGLGIPKLMVDLPGKAGKVPLEPHYLLSMDAEGAVLRAHNGRIVEYRNP